MGINYYSRRDFLRSLGLGAIALAAGNGIAKAVGSLEDGLDSDMIILDLKNSIISKLRSTRPNNTNVGGDWLDIYEGSFGNGDTLVSAQLTDKYLALIRYPKNSVSYLEKIAADKPTGNTIAFGNKETYRSVHRMEIFADMMRLSQDPMFNSSYVKKLDEDKSADYKKLLARADKELPKLAQ